MKVFIPEIENDMYKVIRPINAKDNLNNRENNVLRLINKPPIWSVSNIE